MVEEIALYAAGGLLGAEATGITNFTPVGSSGDGGNPSPPSLPNIPGGGRGASAGISAALQAAQTAASVASGGGGTTVVRDAQAASQAVQDTVRGATEVIRVPTQVDPSGETEQTVNGNGRPPWWLSPESPGGTNYTLDESRNTLLRDSAETVDASASAINDASNATKDFFGWVGDAPDRVDQFGKEVGYNLFNTSEKEIEAIKSGDKKSPGQKLVDSLTGGGSGSSDGSSSSSGDESRGTRGYSSDSSQSERTTTGTERTTSNNQTDNPNRGERTRTVTVPTESQDQSPNDGTSSSYLGPSGGSEPEDNTSDVWGSSSKYNLGA